MTIAKWNVDPSYENRTICGLNLCYFDIQIYLSFYSFEQFLKDFLSLHAEWNSLLKVTMFKKKKVYLFVQALGLYGFGNFSLFYA